METITTFLLISYKKIIRGPLLMKRQEVQKWLDLLKKIPDCREEKIKRIKEEIKRGTYATKEKLKIACKKLLEEISS